MDSLKWEDSVTENPAVGATEVWEFYNGTADAHPMHIHEALFQVVNRQAIIVDEDDKNVQSEAVDRSHATEALGERLEGHRDRLPRSGHPGQDEVRRRRPVRLALSHPRARRQRDDAAVPDRAGSNWAARQRSLERTEEIERPTDWKKSDSVG